MSESLDRLLTMAMTTTPRKIAIIGLGGTHRQAPWRDPSWEIWGMPWQLYPRATRMYELHTQQMCDNAKGKARDEIWLEKARKAYPGIPVYCDPSRMHAFEGAIEYPIKEVMEFLPIPYLENTIAYEIAHALYEGMGEGDTIGLFGIHMMGRGEYTYQRPSVTYLIGLAQGRGVNVVIPPGSPLFLSGYEDGRYGISVKERDPTVITY